MSLDTFARQLLRLSPDELLAYLKVNPDAAPVVMQRLTEAEALVTQADTDRAADWRATPVTMAHHLTRGEVRLFRYSQLLGEKFVDAVEGRSRRQIWTLPPQYGKSTVASQWGPAWFLDRYPNKRILLASYGSNIATRNSYEVRRILRTHDALNVILRPDQQRQDRFSTDQGGGLLATTIKGEATGFGAHGIVIDDPYSNWVQAHSAAYRQLVVDQYRSVFTRRFTSGDAFLILVQTRWHEHDLAGQLYVDGLEGRGEPFELVRLPEVAETHDPEAFDPVLRLPDPLGRSPGEILEPGRFDAEAVAARKLSAQSYFWAGMHQQRPAPEEGGEIKRAWWKLEDALPAQYDQALSSWDMKLKDKESGDYVVGQVWGRTGRDFWMIDQLRGQWDQATTINAIALMAIRHPYAAMHVIENTGNGPEVMAALRTPLPTYVVSDEMAGQLGMVGDERDKVTALRQRGLPGLVANTPKGPKAVRARAVAPYIEAGDVHLPARAVWLGVFIDETSSFPQGAHDDQVDAMSQALSKLSHSEAAAFARRGELPKTPINTRPAHTARITRLGR